MKIFLQARLCSREASDNPKLARYINESSVNISCVSLALEYQRIARMPEYTSLSAGTLEKLEKHEINNSKIVLDTPVTDIFTFMKLGKILSNRYHDELEVVLLADNPLKFYNDFCTWPIYEHIRKRNQKIFFDRELYRVDKFIDAASKISGGEIYVVASNIPLSNERSILDIIGLPWDPKLENIPNPQSLAGKEVARLFFLPKLEELFSLEEWRSISMQFDDVLTRSAPADDFKRLDYFVTKYWCYVKKRFPNLENALEFDNKLLMEAPEYHGPDLGKLASMMPENFVGHFGYLRNGFSGTSAKLFDEFKHICPANSNPKCTVITFAFNQEKYIGECIESVAAQDAGCAIEHVIFDDASTDRTPEIIRAYAEKYPHIRPVLFRHKPATTIGMAFQSCRSEYVAICDGDDYYTDPLKLRKQIALLDKYPDFSLCFHYTDVFFEDGRESCIYPPPNAFKIKGAYTLRELLRGNPIQTSSVMYRWRFRNGLPDWFNPFLRPSDWYWHILHAETGPAGFIPEVMSRYRRHSGACYAGAENVDTARHRRLHGLRELEVYDVLDRHLKHQFHEELSMLASGVFADFFRLLTENGNSYCMDRAASLFPVFARDFLSRIKVVHGKRR